MDFRDFIPLVNQNEEAFASCHDLNDFLLRVSEIALKAENLRERQAYLSVYMAFRDHYPSYLKNFDQKTLQQLDQLLDQEDSKVIKLRRIVLSKISKVA